VLIGNEALRDLADALPFWDRFVGVRVVQGEYVAPAELTLSQFHAVINTQFSRVFRDDLFISRLPARRSVAAYARGVNLTVDEFHQANQFYSDLIQLDPSPMHEVERNFELLNAVTGIGATPTLMRLEPYLSSVDLYLPDRYAVVFPGSSWHKKSYPWPRLVEACRFLHRTHGLISILCGSQDDGAVAGNIQSNAPTETVNLTGRLSLLESFDVIRRATLVVAHDSMAAHAANMLGARSVCIAGGGYNSLQSGVGRFLPYPAHLLPAPASQVVLQYPMPCYDCGYHCKYEALVRDCIPCIDYIPQQALIDALDAAVSGASRINFDTTR